MYACVCACMCACVCVCLCLCVLFIKVRVGPLFVDRTSKRLIPVIWFFPGLMDINIIIIIIICNVCIACVYLYFCTPLCTHLSVYARSDQRNTLRVRRVLAAICVCSDKDRQQAKLITISYGESCF